MSVGAGGKERSDRGGAAVPGCVHEGRLPIRAPLLRVGARPQQRVNHRGVAVQRRHGQRGDARTIGGLDVCTGANQEVGNLEVVVVHRPMKRRGTVGLRRAHIRLVSQQCAQGDLVAFHHGVCHIARSGAGWEAGGASGDQHGDTSGDSPGRGDCPTHDFPLQVLERSRAVALAFLANPEEL